MASQDVDKDNDASASETANEITNASGTAVANQQNDVVMPSSDDTTAAKANDANVEGTAAKTNGVSADKNLPKDGSASTGVTTSNGTDTKAGAKPGNNTKASDNLKSPREGVDAVDGEDVEMLDWNWDGSARAVVPNAALSSATQTVLGTKEHAQSSPLPYGVGVYVGETDGTERQLPLYYVSAGVAAARGRGVKPGWYVVPEVGRAFTLHVTKVTRDIAARQRGHVSVVEIHVDGANIFGFDNENYRADCGTDEVFLGFTESSEYTEGEGYGTERVRPFRFTKPTGAAATAAPADTSAGNTNTKTKAEGAGTVQLKIFQGRAVQARLSVQRKSFDVGEAGGVDEKKAVKEGCSVRVDRAGAPVERPVSRMAETIVHDNKPVGVVNVYLRERYWMESRSLIDAQGNPFVPRTNDAPVDLTLEEGSNADAQPVRKKLKTEVVDLTLVNDNIDLTEE